jgi:hypothetical protein
MATCSPFKYFKTSPEIIRLAGMLYVRFPLSLRNVEDFIIRKRYKLALPASSKFTLTKPLLQLLQQGVA